MRLWALGLSQGLDWDSEECLVRRKWGYSAVGVADTGWEPTETLSRGL